MIAPQVTVKSDSATESGQRKIVRRASICSHTSSRPSINHFGRLTEVIIFAIKLTGCVGPKVCALGQWEMGTEGLEQCLVAKTDTKGKTTSKHIKKWAFWFFCASPGCHPPSSPMTLTSK
jgi:hypothetical protein